jgi:hypothetical protein
MAKGSTAVHSACAGLCITGDYKGWRPTQSWALEKTRMVATRLYSQAKEADNRDEGQPVAAHKAAITAQVSKIFGALYDGTTPQFSESWIVDLLVQLGDLGHIGHGYYIPRESRIVRLTTGWGRIAGGLPLEMSEHPDEGIGPVLSTTVGRLVKINKDFEECNQDAEHSEIFEWLTSTEEKKYERLSSRLPLRTVSCPSKEATVFYNAGFRSGRIRRDRWHNKKPPEEFVVARSGMQPSHYYLMRGKPGQHWKEWFELENEEARLWILLAEKKAGTFNKLSMKQGNQVGTFYLSDMLPGAWTSGILACASSVTEEKEKGGWMVEVEFEALEVVMMLLRSANIHLI